MKPIISIQGVSKRYSIGEKAFYGSLREEVMDALSSPLRRVLKGEARREEPTVWAIKDVSFDVNEGDIVGIVGRNGAGKSTLLKILSRITEPTEGRITMRGRIASLLEVGTGFHPELTGRENIFLNGALLGMTAKEIKAKFDEIVAFSEIEKFLDTPVKRYSSGMYVRLAFAVAAHLEPEILVIDEVLAVGDAVFQKKCLGKMGEVAKGGRTVLFVSHNMGAVRQLCTKAVLLASGKLVETGTTDGIIQLYMASAYRNAASIKFETHEGKRAQITGVRLLDKDENEKTDFTSGEDPIVEISFVIRERLSGLHVACILTTFDGVHVFSTADTDTDSGLFNERLPGAYCVQVKLPTNSLNVGQYTISVGIGIPGVESIDRNDTVSFTLHDTGDFGTMKEGARRKGLLLMQIPWKYVAIGDKDV
ncbi:MAG: ABC transporter ATP-binding protein [Deltaproteobacteria bacterium]|nr:ABC transporter ATP-binding protein [Deltaproteobacteria bacterium]